MKTLSYIKIGVFSLGLIFLASSCAPTPPSTPPEVVSPSPTLSPSPAESSELVLGGVKFSIPSFLTNPSSERIFSKSFNNVRSEGHTVVYRYSEDFDKFSRVFHANVLKDLTAAGFGVLKNTALKPGKLSDWELVLYAPKSKPDYLARKVVQVISFKGNTVLPPTVTFRVFVKTSS